MLAQQSVAGIKLSRERSTDGGVGLQHDPDDHIRHHNGSAIRIVARQESS